MLSSQIEGTQSSLSDLLLFELDEAPGAPMDDVAEVSSYVAALEHGVARLKGGFPLSNRLIREIHEKLLPRGRGSEKAPGEFRRSQNWIGGTRPGNAHFVPPPPAAVEDCMAALERFIHDERSPYPALVKAGLAHVQFETIHPFLDGNGRIGRMLIALLLHDSGVLAQPLLYLSLYFKQHRAEYYRLLDSYERKGTGNPGGLLPPSQPKPDQQRAQAVQTASSTRRCSNTTPRSAVTWPSAAACPRRVVRIFSCFVPGRSKSVTLNKLASTPWPPDLTFPTATKGTSSLHATLRTVSSKSHGLTDAIAPRPPRMHAQ